MPNKTPKMPHTTASTLCLVFSLLLGLSHALVPFIDGGKGMPKLYDGWFNEQMAKQARTAVSKALGAGKKRIEVNFPPVPNVEEVRFGTPLNQKFGSKVVAPDLGVPGGYRPGSNVSRQLLGYANLYWAKQIAPAVAGSPIGGRSVSVVTADAVPLSDIKKSGTVSGFGNIQSGTGRNGAVICVNPGGEETWDRLLSRHGKPSDPIVILNNAYSTTYDLGNTRGYETGGCLPDVYDK
jgi:hypothetical protein